MRLVVAGASLVLALATSTSTSASNRFQVKPCRQTFTISAFHHAATRAYAGARTPTKKDLRRLRLLVRCERRPWDQPVERRIWRSTRRANSIRRMPQALASWYYDGGTTACGFHAYYGVANKSLPCGTHVVIRYGARQTTATVDDRGPYVWPRIWDLNQNVAAAIGFGGVGVVSYRVL